jgi:hypothetical protein
VSRRLVAVLVSLVAVLLVAELAAVPLASRLLSDAAARCVRHESLQVTAVDRPVLPRLAIGRATGVQLEATGLRVGDLRIASAQLTMAEVTLPWAPGTADVLEAELAATVTEEDVAELLRSVTPLPLPVIVRLEDGLAQLGARGVPLSVDLRLSVTPDGQVELAPVAGELELLEQLGLQLTLDPGEQVTITDLTLADGRLDGRADLQVVPGLSDGQGCEEPL